MSLKVSDDLFTGLEELVQKGFFVSKSEAVRHAIKKLIKKNGFSDFNCEVDVFDVVKREIIDLLERRKRYFTRDFARRTGIPAVKIGTALNFLIKHLKIIWEVK